MSNRVEQLLNRIQPVRRDLLKGLLVTGALANIALPASTVLLPTEASAQAKSDAPTSAKTSEAQGNTKTDSKAPPAPTTGATAAGGGGGSCTTSLARTCNAKDPAAFDVCENGKTVTRKCAPGTKCDKGFCLTTGVPTPGAGGSGVPAGAPPAGGGPSGGTSAPGGVKQPAAAKRP